ncbi:MAG: phage tail protein [Rhizobiales bacterium]|nr:phage tail protein [Hyphomicrobiales bacterium]
MVDKISPYCNFNFIVEIQDEDISAGFSEVSGLGSEITVAEYRDGNSPLNNVIKVSGMHKPSDVTLKRGIINSNTLFQWINQTQTLGGDAGKRNVTISLMDEANENAVQSWVLTDAIPIKYTGPQLAAKGGTDVAMEELTLSVTNMVMQQVA